MKLWSHRRGGGTRGRDGRWFGRRRDTGKLVSPSLFVQCTQTKSDVLVMDIELSPDKSTAWTVAADHYLCRYRLFDSSSNRVRLFFHSLITHSPPAYLAAGHAADGTIRDSVARSQFDFSPERRETRRCRRLGRRVRFLPSPLPHVLTLWQSEAVQLQVWCTPRSPLLPSNESPRSRFRSSTRFLRRIPRRVRFR